MFQQARQQLTVRRRWLQLGQELDVGEQGAVTALPNSGCLGLHEPTPRPPPRPTFILFPAWLLSVNALLRTLLQSLPPGFILQGAQHQQLLASPVPSSPRHTEDKEPGKAARSPALPGKGTFCFFSLPHRAPWLECPPLGEHPPLTYLLQAMHFVEVALPELRVGNSHRDLGATQGSRCEGGLWLLPHPSLPPSLTGTTVTCARQ